MRTLTVIIAVFFLIFVLIIALGSAFFTVDPTEYVYVTQFGRHVATYDGGNNATDAGLHIKWPWPIQTVQRLDRRLQHYDLPATELLTQDAAEKTIDKTLTGEAYVCWRIAGKDGVDLFVRRLGTQERVRTLLRDRITGELGALIGKKSMADLIDADSKNPGKVAENMEKLRQDLLNRFKDTARNEYGIDIVDIRLRRINHPLAARGAIFDRIRSERGIRVSRHNSEGEREAALQLSEADRQASDIRTEAEAESIRRIGKADAEADQIRNEAQSKDPQFYEFLKKLDAYKLMFGDGKTVILLSTHRKLLDKLFEEPQLEERSTPVKPPAEVPPPQAKNGGK